jgi:sRNA-binding protein
VRIFFIDGSGGKEFKCICSKLEVQRKESSTSQVQRSKERVQSRKFKVQRKCRAAGSKDSIASEVKSKKVKRQKEDSSKEGISLWEVSLISILKIHKS